MLWYTFDCEVERDTSSLRSVFLQMSGSTCMVIFRFLFKTLAAMKKRKPQWCCMDSPLDRDLRPQIQTVHENFMSYGVQQRNICKCCYSSFCNCRDISGKRQKKKAMLKPLAAMLILNIWLKTIIITYVTY